MPKHPGNSLWKCLRICYVYVRVLCVCEQVHVCGHQRTTSSACLHTFPGTGSLNGQQALGICPIPSPALEYKPKPPSWLWFWGLNPSLAEHLTNWATFEAPLRNDTAERGEGGVRRRRRGVRERKEGKGEGRRKAWGCKDSIPLRLPLHWALPGNTEIKDHPSVSNNTHT